MGNWMNKFDKIRNSYKNGEIFILGSIVEDSSSVFKVIRRGTNYLSVLSEDGVMSRKWLTEVTETKKEFKAIKLKPTDKLKVARMFTSIFGIEGAEDMSSPEQMVNLSLSKTKSLKPEVKGMVLKMLKLADEVGIDYNKKIMPIKESIESPKEELSDDMEDSELDNLIDTHLSDDDYLSLYDDDELAIVDEDSGEEVEDNQTNESLITEVLSRQERIKSRLRFARSKSKRERKLKIALRTHSSSEKINQRSRHLAIILMKKRILRDRPYNTLSVPEKERVDQMIQKRKKIVSRMAMKLAPRVRKTEQNRLSHQSFTQTNT